MDALDSKSIELETNEAGVGRKEKKLNKQMFVVSCSLTVVLCKPLSF